LSRSRRAIWNYASVLLFTAVTAVVGLASTRWLVGTATQPGWLGPSKFGSFRMSVDWLGYLALLDLSLGGILAPLLARASATNDEANLQGVVAAGLRAYLTIATVTLVLGLAMGLAIDRLVVVPWSDRLDLRLAWFVLLLGIPPMALSPYRALAEARQQGYRINLLLIAQSLAIFGTSLGLAWLGWGMFGQALAVTLPAWPLAIVLAVSGISQHPGLGRPAWRTRPDPEVWRTIRTLGASTLLIHLGSRLGVLTDAIVAGDLLGPSMATRLIVTTRLASLAQSQLQAVGGASWAALAELHARGDRETFNRRLVELTGLVTVLGVAGLGPVVAYNRHFMALWLGPEANGGDLLIAVAAFNALVIALNSLWYWCFSGTGQVRRMVPLAVASGLLNLAASIVFTSRFGLVGPLLGTTLAFTTLNLWLLPRYLRQTFGTSPMLLAKAVIVPLAWGMPFVAGLWLISGSHRPWGWLGLAAEMGLGAVMFLGLAMVLIFGPEERAAWLSRLKGLRPR
jgi:O-antigen/teichoic acid export membrane protein